MAEVQITSSPDKHRKAKLSALMSFPDQLEDSADSDTEQNSAAKRRKVSPKKSLRKESLQNSTNLVVNAIKNALDENANTVTAPDANDLIQQENKEFRDEGDEDGDADWQIDEESQDDEEDEDSQDSQGSTGLPKDGASEEDNAKKAGGVKCPECGFMSPNKGELQKHMRKHTPDKPYGCPIPGCTFRTRYPNNIRHHLPSHLDDRPFPCELCELKFKRKSQLTTHMLIHTQVKNFACDQCDSKFKRRWELKMHKLSHSDKKYFKCETCGHETKTLSDLNKHKYKHRDQRDFVCSLCSKAYKDNRALRKHMNYSHSDNPPVECDVCNKQFKNKIYLKKHQLLHEGHYPFECEVCGMKFSSMGNRRSHMVVHSEVGRPYKCPVCPYAGKTELDVRAHIGVMHRKDRIYRCDICLIGFAKEQGLRQHYTTTKHKNNLQKLLEKDGDESNDTEVVIKIEKDDKEGSESSEAQPTPSGQQMTVALFNNEEVTVKIERQDEEEEEAYERDLLKDDPPSNASSFNPVITRLEGGMVVVEAPAAVAPAPSSADVINRVVKKITQQRDKQVKETPSPSDTETVAANKPAKKGKGRKNSKPSRRVTPSSLAQESEDSAGSPGTPENTQEATSPASGEEQSQSDDVNNNTPVPIKPIGTLTLQTGGPMIIKSEPIDDWNSVPNDSTTGDVSNGQAPVPVAIKSEPAW